MDIHKPKPWRGWPELLKEVGTIVVGVLIALGAEQAVQWLHWRHQVEVTEERLAAEVRANLRNAYVRLASQRCYDDSLTNLRNQLLVSGPWRGAAIQRSPVPAPETVPPYMRAGIFTSASPPVYVTSNGVWSDGSWTSSISNGVALHMRQDHADAYSRLYREFATMRDVQSEETDAGSKLSALAFHRNLSDAERTHFLESVGQLSFMNVEMSTIARGVIESASASGIRLKKSQVAALLESGRHYFLVRDCQQPVSIPVTPE